MSKIANPVNNIPKVWIKVGGVSYESRKDQRFYDAFALAYHYHAKPKHYDFLSSWMEYVEVKRLASRGSYDWSLYGSKDHSLPVSAKSAVDEVVDKHLAEGFARSFNGVGVETQDVLFLRPSYRGCHMDFLLARYCFGTFWSAESSSYVTNPYLVKIGIRILPPSVSEPVSAGRVWCKKEQDIVNAGCYPALRYFASSYITLNSDEWIRHYLFGLLAFLKSDPSWWQKLTPDSPPNLFSTAPYDLESLEI